jgi:signal peptidase
MTAEQDAASAAWDRRGRVKRVAAILMLLTLTSETSRAVGAESPLFESSQLTPKEEYTKGIEGPAVDAAGTLYVVNFGEAGTIGKLAAGARKSELFAKLPAGSVGNGIRFDRDGRMYVADFKQHNVLVFQPGESTPTVYFHSHKFNQPNDLAVTADGTLYASDPSFSHHTGQIWRITGGSDGKGRGAVMTSERQLGVTNGIDLSPDEATLYISESNTHEVWSFKFEGDKLVAPHLLRKFDSELDGLRTDVDGRIFVTRPTSGTVAVLAPDGSLVREIHLLGANPTNLTFGGPDGRTVFVTQADGRFIETFRVDRPGREPCLQVSGAAC